MRIPILMIILAGAFGAETFAASPQTADEVTQQLRVQKEREQKAKSSIAALGGDIARLRNTAEATRQENALLNQKIYAKVGVTPQEVESVMQAFTLLASKAKGLDSLYKEGSLLNWENSVVQAEAELSQLSRHAACRLSQTDAVRTFASQSVVAARQSLDGGKQREAERILKEQERLKAMANVVAPPKEVLPPVDSPAVVIPVVAEKPVVVIPMKSEFDGKVYRVGRFSAHKDGTLWDVAAIVYKDPSKWQRLWRANRDIIKNPDRVEPGMEIIVPDGPVPKDFVPPVRGH